MRQILRTSAILCTLLAAAFLLTACEVTPGFVERWENRPGSEERFIEWLHSESTSQDVKVKSMELLLRQWEYSGPMIRDQQRGVLRNIPSSSRVPVMRANLSTIRELMEEPGTWKFRGREQAIYFRRATEDPQLLEEIDGLLVHWFENHWNPCESAPTAVSTSDALNVLGEERGSPFVTRILREGDFHAASICLRDQVSGVEWISTSEDVALAFAHRWDNGPLPGEDNPTRDTQLIRFLEFLQTMSANPAAKAWMIDRVADTEETYRTVFQHILTSSTSEEDVASLVSLLERDSRTRWYAFRLLIDTEEIDGLRRGLSAMPRSANFARWDDEGDDPEAMRKGVEVACGSPKLSEIAEAARPLLHEAAASNHPVNRVIAVLCLSRIGNEESAERLQAIRADLGDDIEIPHWSEQGATLQALIDGAIARIRAPE